MLNWSPDGKSVVIAQGDPQRFEALDVVTGDRKLLAAYPQYPIHDGILSPDAQWFAGKIVISRFVQPVFITSLTNPRAVDQWFKISGDSFNAKPFWSPRGDLLYFYSDEDKFQCPYARRLDPNTKHPIGEKFAVQHFHDNLRVECRAGSAMDLPRPYLPQS